MSLTIAALLALRWCAWLVVDLPVAIGAGSGRLPAERRRAHKLPLPLGSLGAASLHLLSGALLIACVAWAGKASWAQIDDKLATLAQSSLGSAPAGHARPAAALSSEAEAANESPRAADSANQAEPSR